MIHETDWQEINSWIVSNKNFYKDTLTWRGECSCNSATDLQLLTYLVLLDVAASWIRTLESKQERYLGTCKYMPAKQLIKVSVFIIFSTKVGTDY